VKKDGVEMPSPSLDEIVSSGLEDFFEPRLVSFAKAPDKTMPIMKILTSEVKNIQRMEEAVPRGIFLNAALDFTKNTKVMRLIIGYGLNKGMGTDMRSVEQVIGDISGIEIPKSVETNIKLFLQNVPKAEVVLVYALPSGFTNIVVDKVYGSAKITPRQRAEVLQKKFLELFMDLKNVLQLGNIRGYMSECAIAREVKMDKVAKVIELATKK